jgi:hypothetical protein
MPSVKKSIRTQGLLHLPFLRTPITHSEHFSKIVVVESGLGISRNSAIDWIVDKHREYTALLRHALPFAAGRRKKGLASCSCCSWHLPRLEKRIDSRQEE